MLEITRPTFLGDKRITLTFPRQITYHCKLRDGGFIYLEKAKKDDFKFLYAYRRDGGEYPELSRRLLEVSKASKSVRIYITQKFTEYLELQRGDYIMVKTMNVNGQDFIIMWRNDQDDKYWDEFFKK